MNDSSERIGKENSRRFERTSEGDQDSENQDGEIDQADDAVSNEVERY